uniref:CHCH domain-containing protein n=1 Tax=Parascaris univalens TaxID=6257 RepID=A0A915BWF8_PARUN
PYRVGPELAYVKKSVARFIAVEVVIFGGAFLGFCLLRRSERTREFLYRRTPAVADLYYWAEDSISFGQLTGTRLKRSDLNRWLSNRDGVLESD